MFESIVIRRSPALGNPMEGGLIAEALLFYQNVHLLLDHGSLGGILETIGPDNFFRLLDEGHARATYIRTMFATQTTSSSGISVHQPIEFQFQGHGRKMKREELVIELFERSLGKSRATRQWAQRFLAKVPIKNIVGRPEHPHGISGLAREHLRDSHYVQDAVEISIREMLPTFSFPAHWRFELVELDDGFIVDTDLDFASINAEFRRLYRDISLTPSNFITNIVEVCADLTFSSEYMAEYVTAAGQSKMMQRKISGLLNRRLRSAEEIKLFQEMHLGEGHAIREAINSGERSFVEFLELLDQARKFKEWLRAAHPDRGLLSEYHQAVIAKSWIEQLPAKVFRFVFFNASGVVAEKMGFEPAGSLAAGAADSFLVDKIFRGWRPNHFVQGPLQKFTP